MIMTISCSGEDVAFVGNVVGHDAAGFEFGGATIYIFGHGNRVVATCTDLFVPIHMVSASMHGVLDILKPGISQWKRDQR